MGRGRRTENRGQKPEDRGHGLLTTGPQLLASLVLVLVLDRVAIVSSGEEGPRTSTRTSRWHFPTPIGMAMRGERSPKQPGVCRAKPRPGVSFLAGREIVFLGGFIDYGLAVGPDPGSASVFQQEVEPGKEQTDKSQRRYEPYVQHSSWQDYSTVRAAVRVIWRPRQSSKAARSRDRGGEPRHRKPG
jgi:hypothetical protein